MNHDRERRWSKAEDHYFAEAMPLRQFDVVIRSDAGGRAAYRRLADRRRRAGRRCDSVASARPGSAPDGGAVGARTTRRPRRSVAAARRCGRDPDGRARGQPECGCRRVAGALSPRRARLSCSGRAPAHHQSSPRGRGASMSWVASWGSNSAGSQSGGSHSFSSRCRRCPVSPMASRSSS